MERPILVTGATGNVGSAVITALLARGLPVRAAGLEPDTIRGRFPGAEAVRFDFTDATTFASALDGVSGLFLLRPPPISRVGPTLNALVDEAARRGIGHVVFSSVAGADTNLVVPHHRVETHLRASGLPHTILRPGFFAQNLGDQYRGDIRDDGRLYVPAGDGQVAFVDVRDLAEVAAAIFADPVPHRGAGYLLTGPDAVTFEEVAATLSAVLGRHVRYDRATVAGYARHLHGHGVPLPAVVVQTILHVGLRRGDAATVDPTLERLLGRRPRTIADYIADHVERWADGVATPSVPAVERRHPPKALWDAIVNPAMRRLLRHPPTARIVGDALVLLRFRGRRSGRLYEIPAAHQWIDGAPCVLTNSGWRVNFRGGHPLEVLFRGEPRSGTATLVEDLDRVADIYQQLIAELGWRRAGHRLGIRVNVRRTPTRDELTAAVRADGLAILQLDVALAATSRRGQAAATIPPGPPIGPQRR